MLRDSLDVVKWGCMRYLSIVSVLLTVDGGRHWRQFGEAGTAVDGGSSKTYSPKSFQMYAMKNIFNTLPCSQTALSEGELKLLFPSMLSSKPPHSFENKKERKTVILLVADLSALVSLEVFV